MSKKEKLPDYTWKELNARLPEATEEECFKLLDKEVNGKRRYVFIMRLYGRFSKLRREREMAEAFSS